jgi:hypothetical protein
MKYICPRCNYFTNRKSNFKNHLTRKKICTSIIEDVPINSIAKTYKIIIKNTNKHKSRQCGKLNNRYENEYIYSKNKSKIVEFNNYNKNELKYISKTVSKLLKKLEGTSIKNNVINNTQNNTQNNNTQNNNQQVKINNFGEEDLSYITKENYKNLLIDPRNSITKLINDTHFNSEHPENSNICIPNKKQPFVELYVDNSWKVFNRYKTICNILRGKKELIHNKFNEIKNELTKKEQTTYLNYKELIDRDLFMVKNVLVDIQATIISGTRHKPTEFETLSKEQDPIQKILEKIPESFLYEQILSDDENYD